MSSLPSTWQDLPPAALSPAAAGRKLLPSGPSGTSLLQPQRPAAGARSNSNTATVSSGSRPGAALKPTLKSQSLMLASGSLKRRDYDDDDVFAMDIDDDMNYYGRGGPSDDDCMGDDTDEAPPPPPPPPPPPARSAQRTASTDENIRPSSSSSSSRGIAITGGRSAASAAADGQVRRASSSAPASAEPVHPHATLKPHSKAAGKLPMAMSEAFKLPMAGPSPRGPLPMAAPADLPRRAVSGPAAPGATGGAAAGGGSSASGGSRRTSEAEAADRIKKPRRSNSASAPSTPMLTPAGTPLLGPAMAPFHIGSAGSVAGSTTQAGSSSRGGSKGSSPKFGPSPSPKLGPTAGMMMPFEADLQPRTMLRQHEFKSGRRIFHVHFGHGFVRSIDSAEPDAAKQEPGGTPGTTPPEADPGRSLSASQNINVHFDNPKYKSLRLRAFYAVPKMVVIPSTQALRKAKLHSIVCSTPPAEAARVQLVRSLLVSGAVRSACSLVHRWQLERHFPPAQLIEKLLGARCHAAAVRFAREFGLHQEHPVQQLLRSMLDGKQYEGALKQVGTRSALVDGERSPSDVVRLMVAQGQHALALKYVHKFALREAFPPEELVRSALPADADDGSEAEVNVRTWGLVLKYVRVFGLESAFPLQGLVERAAAGGVTVHEMDGKFVLKGRMRQSASGPSANPSSTGSSPMFGPSPALLGIGGAASSALS